LDGAPLNIDSMLKPLPKPVPLPEGHRVVAEPCAACSVRILSVCNAIGDEHLDRLAASVVSHKVAPHRTFVVEGEPADALFNITEGAVKVYKLLPDGRQQITGFLFAGDFLGLSANERYAYSAEAISEVTYCRFARTKLERLLSEFPQMERRLLGIASNELAAAQDQMLLLGRKTAREKVASFLLSLSRRAAKNGRRASPVELPMTRTDIADYLGLTIETVSRTFSQLRKDRLVGLPTPSSADLLNIEKLEEISEGA
jgi:CRP/FNR family transcriptional regulator